MSVETVLGTMDNYSKGGVEITGVETASHYLFSNMFEVANKSAPWERVVIAKNLEFTVECSRAEGQSPWYVCSHDETALLVQGEAEIHFVKPDDSSLVPPEDKEGAVRLRDRPDGQTMGHVKAKRGHLTLLPGGSAYQIRPAGLGVVLFQSILGDESIEKWADICQQ